jgi:ribonuclease VapC
MDVQDLHVPAFSSVMADLAADAAERYGRGSRHPARLNFGDCLSYAVAKHLKAPLLFKGNDFTHTDIESALPA